MPQKNKKGKKGQRDTVKKVAEWLGGVEEVEGQYNRPDKPPFFYNVDYEGGVIKWVCEQIPTGEIISVYEYNPKDGAEAVQRQEYQLENIEEALRMRDDLLAKGYKPTTIPRAVFNIEGKELNRTQRRKLAGKILAGDIPLEDPKPHDEDLEEGKEVSGDKPADWKYSWEV